MMSVGHVLDHVLDHMIMGLVTTALQFIKRLSIHYAFLANNIRVKNNFKALLTQNFGSKA